MWLIDSEPVGFVIALLVLILVQIAIGKRWIN